MNRKVIIRLSLLFLVFSFAFSSALANPTAKATNQETIAVYGLSSASYLAPSSATPSLFITHKRWYTPAARILRLPPLFYYAGLPIFMTIFGRLIINYISAFESDQRVKSFKKPWVDFD